MKFSYNQEKNELLLRERGIGFNEIIKAIEEGWLLEVAKHANTSKYPNQKILYVRIAEKVYAVPFVESADGDVFLKTLFPSRKARKEFLYK